MLAPMITAMPAASEIISALTKEIVTSDTKVLDCISVVLTTPKVMPFHNRLVKRRNMDSSVPPVKALKPSSRHTMPNMNRATPAAISLKLALAHRP